LTKALGEPIKDDSEQHDTEAALEPKADVEPLNALQHDVT